MFSLSDLFLTLYSLVSVLHAHDPDAGPQYGEAAQGLRCAILKVQLDPALNLITVSCIMKRVRPGPPPVRGVEIVTLRHLNATGQTVKEVTTFFLPHRDFLNGKEEVCEFTVEFPCRQPPHSVVIELGASGARSREMILPAPPSK
jgi:hypothetical protein